MLEREFVLDRWLSVLFVYLLPKNQWDSDQKQQFVEQAKGTEGSGNHFYPAGDLI